MILYSIRFSAFPYSVWPSDAASVVDASWDPVPVKHPLVYQKGGHKGKDTVDGVMMTVMTC